MKIELNKIYCADCLEVMKGIPDKSIDMILCDLPYGTTACKWDTIIPFEPLWEQYKRIIKDNGAIVLTASQPFTSALVMSNPKMFKYCGYWIKDKPSNFLMGRKQPLRYVEEWTVFYKNLCTYNPIMELREQKNKRKNKLTSSLLKNEIIGINEKTDKYQERLLSGTKDYIYPRNYQFFNNRTKGLHPTQKPVALFEYLIKTYTNEGDLVLDNCAGSGTTGVACKNLNRNFILIEKEQKYVDIAKKRIEEA
jgi:site-specific DNA-methyltransferase (adenine-specific)